ncbi:MAG: hypothetical protein UW16_C0026G0004 [Microgenomates group bacterium GW2011_GWC1_44_10]|uniref:Uncharacterized protein n=1 Tax=Candidatus Woesebacteria bacterium GW2011_GWA2_44_33 TaxID=1618564 RepID=A0A0G1J6N3_9BACT|nr:MAG: hypothetical protein UW16_C0026G0004 [Microgenomates group bacterium GW2011_GWC1_44_10]KKT67296.1 MAG: hypothetical protein UW60_C0009G0002 [Candidatus Woesebacteria bacterium GW2011_GWA2_44_33]
MPRIEEGEETDGVRLLWLGVPNRAMTRVGVRVLNGVGVGVLTVVGVGVWMEDVVETEVGTGLNIGLIS